MKPFACIVLLILAIPAEAVTQTVYVTFRNEGVGTVKLYRMIRAQTGEPRGEIESGSEVRVESVPGDYWFMTHQLQGVGDYTVGQADEQRYVIRGAPADDPDFRNPTEPITAKPGRYVDRNISLPSSRDDARVPSAISSNYVFPSVLRVTWDRGNAILAGPLRENRLASGRKTLPPSALNQYGSGSDEIKLHTESELSYGGKMYAAVAPYQVVAQGPNTSFGAQFTERLAFHQSMYRGWDLTKIDPMDFQSSRPLDDVFLLPAPTSHDYHLSRTGRGGYVPHGLILLADPHSSFDQETRTHVTEESRMIAWSAKVGVSASIPFVATGAANFAVRSKLDRMTQNQTIYGHAEVVDIQYTLLIDPRHIVLDPDFKHRVRELLAQAQAGRAPDFASFVTKYGTHYAAALTMGSRYYCETAYTESMVRELQSLGASIDIHGEASVEGFGVGGSAGGSLDVSEGFRNAISRQRQRCSALGGRMGSNANWNAGGTSEVPLMGDFRPLSDLMSGIHFDEPDIGRMAALFWNWMLDYTKRPDLRPISNTPPAWVR